jgi:hypothetical protein
MCALYRDLVAEDVEVHLDADELPVAPLPDGVVPVELATPGGHNPVLGEGRKEVGGVVAVGGGDEAGHRLGKVVHLSASQSGRLGP